MFIILYFFLIFDIFLIQEMNLDSKRIIIIKNNNNQKNMKLNYFFFNLKSFIQCQKVFEI